MLIGEKYQSKLVWIQLYDTSLSLEEDELRDLLREIKSQILRNRIKSGSARKFLDGKLVYYELTNGRLHARQSKVFALYTHDLKVGIEIKKSIKSIADRGGGYTVYSAKRFFSEMIDLASNPSFVNSEIILTEREVLRRVENYYTQAYDVNELGQIISFLTRAAKLDYNTLEKIYLHVYESLQSLQMGALDTDPDEFLDAAYIVARRYEQLDNYRLALELFKHITLIAAMNQRYDLETACKIRTAVIYKKYFPPTGEYILDAFSTVAEIHLLETAKPHKEIYFCLLAHAHSVNDDQELASKFFTRAIEEAGVNISSPEWIAEAYDSLGRISQSNYYLLEAVRYYLTGATIALSSGDVVLADDFRNNAANAEIQMSNILIKSALSLRMEGRNNDAEYRAWNALRYVIRAYDHAKVQTHVNLVVQSLNILEEAEFILNIHGKKRRNRSILNKIKKFIGDIEPAEIKTNQIVKKMVELEELIETNIPIPPPTFMLITLDGQLVMMGKIVDNEWTPSEIEGVILGGILVAIMSLLNEVSGKTSLKTIDAGNFKVMIEHSSNLVTALLLDRDIPEFRDNLIQARNYVDNKYGEMLRFWNGKKATFNPLQPKIAEFLSKRE